MIVLAALKTLIASKIAAVGAGTALVAGGLAVASPDVLLLEPAADETEVVDEGDPVDDVTPAGDGEGSDEASDTQGLDGTEGVDDDPTATEEEEDDGDPTGEGEDDDDRTDAALREIDADDVASEGEGSEGQGETNRSETAEAVQQVIDQRETFEHGREFGKAVSEAARGERGAGNDARTGDQNVEDPADGTTESGAGDDDVSIQSSDDSAASNGKGNRPAHAGPRS